MVTKKHIVFFIALAICSGICLGVYKMYDRFVLGNDLPGSVIGENPKRIPESKLPICDFTGSRFINTPCYSPHGADYL